MKAFVSSHCHIYTQGHILNQIVMQKFRWVIRDLNPCTSDLETNTQHHTTRQSWSPPSLFFSTSGLLQMEMYSVMLTLLSLDRIQRKKTKIQNVYLNWQQKHSIQKSIILCKSWLSLKKNVLFIEMPVLGWNFSILFGLRLPCLLEI